MQIFNFKRISGQTIWNKLIGSDDEFFPDHQFFNAYCLVIIVIAVFSIVGYYAIGLPNELCFILGFFTIVTVFLYFLSRVKRIFTIKILWVLDFLIPFAIFFVWILDGGICGSAPPFLLLFSAFALYMAKQWQKILYALYLILCVSCMFFFEYYYPSIIVQYSSRPQKYIDLYSTYLISIILLVFLINNMRRFYENEKNNTANIIESYRQQSQNLKQELEEKVSALSVKERVVFKMIIEGKSNKEIADEFSVSVSTVKTHVNNMYKKLGTKNRTEVQDLGNSQI